MTTSEKMQCVWARGITMPDQENGSEVFIEKDLPGKPHQDKVFVAIHAHLDDIPYY